MAPAIFRRRAGASDRGAEMGKMPFLYNHFAKLIQQKPEISSNKGGSFRQGAVAPSGPPLAPRHHCFEAPPCHEDNQK